MDQLSYENFGLGEAGLPSSQRGGGRDSLLLAAQLRLDDGELIQARVRNLSAGGLMAETAEELMPGKPIEIEVRGIGWVKGRVAWAAEGRTGIAFEKAIDPMRARKPVAAAKKSAPVVTPFRRKGL